MADQHGHCEVITVKWRRRAEARPSPATGDPLVVAVTEPVTRATADALVARVERLAGAQRVVVDLTAIPAFDSEGATALLGLQETLGGGRLTIVGFRQATARLTDSGDWDAGTLTLPAPAPAPDAGPVTAAQTSAWVVRRLRAIAVVQTVDDRPATTEGLEPAVNEALASDVGIVVVDLRGAALTRAGEQVIAFASSSAALAGQELLVVNVDESGADRLRRAGLSATTFIAPEPLPE